MQDLADEHAGNAKSSAYLPAPVVLPAESISATGFADDRKL